MCATCLNWNFIQFLAHLFLIFEVWSVPSSVFTICNVGVGVIHRLRRCFSFDFVFMYLWFTRSISWKCFAWMDSSMLCRVPSNPNPYEYSWSSKAFNLKFDIGSNRMWTIFCRHSCRFDKTLFHTLLYVFLTYYRRLMLQWTIYSIFDVFWFRILLSQSFSQIYSSS